MSAGSRGPRRRAGRGIPGRHRCGPGARGRGPAPGWPGPPRPPSPGPRPPRRWRRPPGVGGDVGDLGAGVPGLTGTSHRAQSKHPSARPPRERRRGAPEHRSPPPPRGRTAPCLPVALRWFSSAVLTHGPSPNLMAGADGLLAIARPSGPGVIMAGPAGPGVQAPALTPAIRPRQHGSHGRLRP